MASDYQVNTDWVLMKELKACVGGYEALRRKLYQTDPNTRYIFEKVWSIEVKCTLVWSMEVTFVHLCSVQYTKNLNMSEN